MNIEYIQCSFLNAANNEKGRIPIEHLRNRILRVPPPLVDQDLGELEM